MLSDAPRKHKTIHQRVAATLRDRIAKGIYPEDEMMPTELSLSAEFDVSRHTMREALKTLVLEGLIERSPGRGTVISSRSALEGAWGIKSLEELIGEFVASDVTVIYKGPVQAKKHMHAAKVFGLRRTDTLFQLKRVMGHNQAPAVVNTLYTLMKYARRLPEEMIGYKPLIALIEEYCKVQPTRARQVASAMGADSTAAKLLGVRVGTPLLVLRRIFLNSENEPLQLTELICRPDRYQQSVDFMRANSLDRRNGR